MSDSIVVKTYKGIFSLVYSAVDVALSILPIDTYRLRTKAHALYSLCILDERDIDAYLGSYILFDGDWTNENGKKDDHIVDYYNVINHLCALGSVEKMYIPPLRDENVGIVRNQELYELKMMADIGLSPVEPKGNNNAGLEVMDIGCGRGRIAMHVAKTTGAHVSGLNIDPSQIANAKSYAKRIKLENQTHFQVRNLNEPLPYEDESMDAAYEVQAFTYVKDRDAVFKEIYRVLKPGAKFSMLDWMLLDNYDEKNPEHVDYVKRTMPFIGAVTTVHYNEFEKAMKNAGFKVLLSEDASIGGHQLDLINSERAQYAWIRTFAKFFLPKRFKKMLMRLKQDAEAFCNADKLRIATTSYQIVCQKPEKK